jgi:spermidine/putrescine transport system permease protein
MSTDVATVVPEPAGSAPSPTRSLTRRFGDWFADPFRKPRTLASVTWLYIAWSLLPVLVAIRISFNEGRSRSAFQGWSLKWWIGDGDSVLHNPELAQAMRNSITLGLATMLIATPLGVALAVGLARWRGYGRRPANTLMLIPLVTPELVMGSALLIVFTTVFDFISLGRGAQLIGHVTFSISYVVVITRGRLFSIGRDIEEAAQDLGATPIQAIRTVLLPLLGPAIFASLMIVFATSLDDFVISAWLSKDASDITVPVRIYNAAKKAPTPSLNALATFMMICTFLAIALAMWIPRLLHRGTKTDSESAVKDFAALDL